MNHEGKYQSIKVNNKLCLLCFVLQTYLRPCLKSVVHEIGPILVSNWEKKHVICQNLANFIRKRIPVLTSLKNVVTWLNMMFTSKVIVIKMSKMALYFLLMTAKNKLQFGQNI